MSREEFAGFPMPRDAAVFEPTFRGTGMSDRTISWPIPRYGQKPAVSRHTEGPFAGAQLPGGAGHVTFRRRAWWPVLWPCRGRAFSPSEPNASSSALAAQAAVAIDNARLYQSSQLEIEARKQTEQKLQTLNLKRWSSGSAIARRNWRQASAQLRKANAASACWSKR